MNRICLGLLLTFTLFGCGNNSETSKGSGIFKGSDTPKDLAAEACECWTEMKTIQNSTAKMRKMDECFGVTQRKLSELREMGVAKDWTDEQVRQAEREFDSVYDACK